MNTLMQWTSRMYTYVSVVCSHPQVRGNAERFARQELMQHTSSDSKAAQPMIDANTSKW
jgi:prephenate dehydratase